MGPMLPGIYHIPYPDVQSAGVGHLSEPEQAEHFMRPLREMCETYLPADEIACVVMEPIAGDAGIIVPPQAYVDALTAFCRENGILFAVDEINQAWAARGSGGASSSSAWSPTSCRWGSRWPAGCRCRPSWARRTSWTA